MTDHEAGDLLLGLTIHASMRCSEALRLGAAALRQPRLPKLWPLVWRPADEPGWMIAVLPLNAGHAYASRDGRWIVRYRSAFAKDPAGTRSRARDARRAAARAVARAVKESTKGGEK